MTIRQYIGSWITTFRLARKYGIEGAQDHCKKKMMLEKMRYYKLTGRKLE